MQAEAHASAETGLARRVWGNAVTEKYFENKDSFLKKLYTEGKDFWENDRKDWYNENYALTLNKSPLLDLVEEGGFAPHIPLITTSIDTRRAQFEGVQSQLEEPYSLKPWIEPPDELKAATEERIERLKVRVEFAKKI